MAHPYAVFQTAAGGKDITGNRVINGNHRTGMAVTKSVQNIAIGLLKRMETIYKN